MRAGTAQKILKISKNTLLKRTVGNLAIEKTASGGNIFTWKHIINLTFQEKYANLVPAQKIISICQNKGGVGKTTSVVNLATAFSYLGKTLIIDLDSQASLSQSFNYYLKKEDISIADVFEKPELINGAILPVSENLFILPNHLKFELVQRSYYGKENIKFILKKALRGLDQEFNFIIIDTPPNLSIGLDIALYASDYCIIPFQPQPYSLDGIQNIIEYIKSISENDNTGNFNPRVLGVFINLFEQNILYEQVASELKATYPTFKTTISKAVAIPQSQAVKESIFEFDEANRVCQEYYELFFEILERVIG